MVEYADIRIFVRDGRHNGTTYNVTIWANSGVGRYSLEEVAIDGLPAIKVRDGSRYASLDDAFDAGHALARETIDG